MSDPWVALAERLDKGLAAAGKMFTDGAPLAVVHHGFGYRTDLDFTLGDVRWLVGEVKRLRSGAHLPLSDDGYRFAGNSLSQAFGPAAPAPSATWPGPWDCDPHFGVDGRAGASPVTLPAPKPRGVFVTEGELRERVRTFGPMNAAIKSRLSGHAVNDWLAGNDGALADGQRQALLNAIREKDGPRELLAVSKEKVRA